MIMLGPPGAGKGTQSAVLADTLGVPKISSGDLFRSHHANDTDFGRLVNSYMEQGLLVPDDITIRMVMEWINNETDSSGFLLDGFPRTTSQATALDTAIRGQGGLDKAIYIKVSQPELVRRLSNRLLCSDCQTPHTMQDKNSILHCSNCGGKLYQRDDDKPSSVKQRIKTYIQETEPLVDYYRKAELLDEVDGNRSIEEVSGDLISLFKSAQ